MGTVHIDSHFIQCCLEIKGGNELIRGGEKYLPQHRGDVGYGDGYRGDP